MVQDRLQEMGIPDVSPYFFCALQIDVPVSAIVGSDSFLYRIGCCFGRQEGKIDPLTGNGIGVTGRITYQQDILPQSFQLYLSPRRDQRSLY